MEDIKIVQKKEKMSSSFMHREDNPILIFDYSESNYEHNLVISFRDIQVDGVPLNQIVKHNTIAVGVIPDVEFVSKVKLPDDRKRQVIDHFYGTTLVQFVLRGLGREKMPSILSINLFSKKASHALKSTNLLSAEQPRINTDALTALFQLIFSSFPQIKPLMLIDVEKREAHFRIESRGVWTAYNGQEFPPIAPTDLSISLAGLERYFEERRALLGDQDPAIEAVNRTLIAGFAKMLYDLRFSGPVDPELLQDPHKLIYREEKSLSDLLEIRTRGIS